MCFGAFAYSVQLREGLSATGMYDSVSWGLYISNFTFLVGVAAAAVTLVLPTYILHDVDFKQAVLIGEGLAVSALIMAIAFVVVDVGSPARLWHLIPGIGVNELAAFDAGVGHPGAERIPDHQSRNTVLHPLLALSREENRTSGVTSLSCCYRSSGR